MATTNIVMTKHTDGRPVKEEDIKVGMVLEAPSLTGGVLDYRCVSLTADKAEFESTNKDWPIGFEMRFNEPDFELDDFVRLADALRRSYGSLSPIVTPVQAQIVTRAHELGYVHRRSQTQVNWTEMGLEAFAALRDKAEPIMVNGYKIQYNHQWKEWQVSHEDIGPCGEFIDKDEAVTFAEKGDVSSPEANSQFGLQ